MPRKSECLHDQITDNYCDCDKCFKARRKLQKKIDSEVSELIRTIVNEDESHLPMDQKVFMAICGLGECAAEEKISYYTRNYNVKLTPEEMQTLRNWNSRDMAHMLDRLVEDLKPSIKELN